MAPPPVIWWKSRKWHPYRADNIEKLYKVQRNGCWLWKGSVHKASGKPIFKGWAYANRILYKRKHGYLPEMLRRTCETKLCVNPDHWEASE